MDDEQAVSGVFALFHYPKFCTVYRCSNPLVRARARPSLYHSIDKVSDMSGRFAPLFVAVTVGVFSGM